ncbi:LysR family transcriptional regulator of gallate degradation [Azomonas agilis]|uniref:LysR family transcriptional regulator of gallate degradation n=1 Tax=Azomonas agilis TaxID=116849 RepID=A0A562IYH7_9GAMM|nr:LysR family transcriptional regulator [Azomonas agilis]TWH75900.1 LysR family transcriptional regulator of gallate degradation [Azomonas agilis]
MQKTQILPESKKHLNLMHIRAFIKVAECESISKAANTLYRSQPVITRSISDLEKRLSVLLFERHIQGMRLSNYGKQILPRAKQAISELLSIADLINQTHEPIYLYNTKRLELFIKLSETYHVQTVANHFGLTQPAVSTALKTLEQGFGFPLFERTPKGLQPTKISDEISVFVRRALNELKHIDSDIAALQGEISGKVVVGALPLGRTRILPEAIVRMVSAYPKIQIVTIESPFDLLAKDLRTGDIDFILGALRSTDYASDLFGEKLLTEDLVILVRKNHPLLSQENALDNLSLSKWILPRAGSPSREQIDHYFDTIGMNPPDPVVETGDLAIIRGVLIRSDILAIVSNHQLEYEIKSGDLVKLPIYTNHTKRDIGLIYRSKCLHSPAANILMEFIKSVVQDSKQHHEFI